MPQARRGLGLELEERKKESEWEGSDSDERSEETAVQATYHLQV